MYYCQDCGNEFEVAAAFTETHGLSSPPFETRGCCPRCSSENYHEKTTAYCRSCGSKLSRDKREYCSDKCRSTGEKLWQREIKRRRLNVSNPLAVITREIEQYNREHHTKYSYGQYVALIRPTLKGKREQR